jgi:DNA-binding NtrC family response regulator
LYRRFFEKQGFVISHCDNGADALKLIQSGQDQFDLVLTDYSLPQMTGKQLAQTLVEIQPDLPIILMTGYSDVLSKNEAESMGIRHYLMKPIDLEVLQEAIESCLLA